MQNQSDPKLNYKYYAVRYDPNHLARDGWSNGPQWDIIFLVICHSQRFAGMYSFPDGNRYWVSHITWEEFDMLTAFGVEWIKNFDHATRLIQS